LERSESAHRIVLDTNILISAIISAGYPYQIIRNVIALNKAQLLLSRDILSEYEAVVSYSKFSKFQDFDENAKMILFHINRVAHFYEPNFKLSVVKDVADNKFLELASYAKADFLITGNTRDFTFSKYEGIAIISPREYYLGYWK
jgi:putative PIN family toxin of toxin-antitoxin system